MSDTSKVSVELLSPSHDLSKFVCAIEPALESFLRDRALALTRSNVCAVYLVRGLAGELYGYFTLSPTALFQQSLSNTQARKFPYNPISAMLLGQFARDTDISPKGFGATLLREAFVVALETLGWQVLCLDPFSDGSEAWFRELGFRQAKQHYPLISSDQPIRRLQLYMTRQDVLVTLDALGG